MAPQSAFGPESQSVKRGRAEFQGVGCSRCHGSNAEGGSGSDMLRSPLIRRDSCGDELRKLVVSGNPSRGMPATAITDAQAYDIADYLHWRVDESDFLPQLSVPEIQRMLMTGDPDAGKAYFNGPGGCADCHSPTGDLKGIATKYGDPFTLQLRFISPTGVASDATVTVGPGQQFKGRLVSLDVFYVSIQDGDGWNRTWQRDKVKVEVQDRTSAHKALIQKYTNADIHNLLAYLETLK
jgi:cytochrome c oxidase cbb3-type subunit 3